jgi:hypothetical protein
METSNGSVVGTDVVVTGDGQKATIHAGRRARVQITDTYNATPIPPPGPGGSLLITKTIAGPRAGDQGPVTIHTVCNGTALADFVIAAGTPAGSVSHIFDGIPAGSVCAVTETLDGSTATVIANVSGNGQSVMVPAGEVVPVSLMDVYDEGSPAADASGTLTVIKHIAGPGARRHGRIAILVACGGPLNTFSFIIPAHTGPGSVMRHFDNIPAGSRCKVTETADGETNTVAVAARGGRTVTLPATGTVTVHLTDRFTPIVKAVAPTFTG